MSKSEPTSAQANALRAALRARERQREQGVDGTTRTPAAGPPDLADVFGKLFGLGKALKTKIDNAPSRKGALRTTVRDSGRAVERKGERKGDWRQRLQESLGAAKAQIESIQAAAARKKQEDADPPQVFRAPDTTTTDASGHDEARARRSAFADSSDQPAAAPPPGRRSSAAGGRMRGARVARLLRDPARLREFIIARELLGPPLAMRRRAGRVSR